MITESSDNDSVLVSTPRLSSGHDENAEKRISESIEKQITDVRNDQLSQD